MCSFFFEQSESVVCHTVHHTPKAFARYSACQSYRTGNPTPSLSYRTGNPTPSLSPFFLQNKKEEGKIRRTKRPVVLPSSKTLRRSKTPFLSSQSSHRNKQGAAIHPPRCYSTRYRLLLAAFLVLDSSLSAGASISNQCEFGVWGLFLDFAIIDFLWGFDLVL